MQKETSAPRLMWVITLTLSSPQQIADALRRARLTHARAGAAGALLFLCDLESAPFPTLPEDAALVRCVQSGVMSMAARRPETYYFLVRRRQWSPAQRLYLGAERPFGARKTLHALLHEGGQETIQASNFSQGAFSGAVDAVFIADAALRFLPSLPDDMHEQLTRRGLDALSARIIYPVSFEEPLFARLARAGFSFLPACLARADEAQAAVLRISALSGPPPQAHADGCFALSAPPTLRASFARLEQALFSLPAPASALLVLRAALLLLSALAGRPLLAAACVVLPEALYIRHLSNLPGALVRLAFLPQTTVAGVSALINRALRARGITLSLKRTPGSCVLFGAALLLLSLRSVQALSTVVSVSLLMIAAPAIEAALSLPARRRIPLSNGEQAQLRAMTAAAFDAVWAAPPSAGRLLCCCAGCMLNLLEADEAARMAEGMLGAIGVRSAFDCACLLCAARYFEEQMGKCDAALRGLPQAILSRAGTPPACGGKLGALLRAAMTGMPAGQATDAMRSTKETDAMDALFFPRAQMPDLNAFAPVLRPHTFLEEAAKKSDPPLKDEEAVNRFLIFACASLDAPFHALLLRSGPVVPYAALWSLA